MARCTATASISAAPDGKGVSRIKRKAGEGKAPAEPVQAAREGQAPAEPIQAVREGQAPAEPMRAARADPRLACRGVFSPFPADAISRLRYGLRNDDRFPAMECKSFCHEQYSSSRTESNWHYNIKCRATASQLGRCSARNSRTINKRCVPSWPKSLWAKAIRSSNC